MIVDVGCTEVFRTEKTWGKKQWWHWRMWVLTGGEKMGHRVVNWIDCGLGICQLGPGCNCSPVMDRHRLFRRDRNGRKAGRLSSLWRSRTNALEHVGQRQRRDQYGSYWDEFFTDHQSVEDSEGCKQSEHQITACAATLLTTLNSWIQLVGRNSGM